MTEYEMTERIRASAEAVQIPEKLLPDAIRLQLAHQTKQEKHDCPSDKKNHSFRSKSLTAAVIFLVCGIGIYGTCRMSGGFGAETDEPQYSMTADDAAESKTTEQTDDAASMTRPAALSPDSSDSGESVHPAQQIPVQKSNAGDLYVVAENYEQVYDRLQHSYYSGYTTGSSADKLMDDTAWVESAENPVMNSTSMEGAESSMAEDFSDSTSRSDAYSKTNVVTEGVDESDIVKTDGTCLYLLQDDRIRIIDVQGQNMKQIGEISILMDDSSSRVMEMYVDGNVLNLILEKQETQLKQQEGEDVFYMDSDIVTELLTYDISDRENPVFSGSITQDGSYRTSRKIGTVVYLFSEQYMETDGMVKSRAILEENTSGWIPLVNGRPVAADCIYLPEQGNNGLLVSSVDVTNPKETIDQTLILHGFVDVYVSTESLYLYHTDYSGSEIYTQIAKFSLKQGNIDAVGAVSAEGEVCDTFAIWEQNGKLRLLTTDQSGPETENALFLFDEDLKLTGTLKGIAKGEEIYAARFFGDMAYFVTYRNTDPLFAVDLSDETNPKILSELKITGFSEYLHLWGTDKLFGIGFETDPDSGRTEGIKLTMFDISDPADLTVAGNCVIRNIDYSPALYQYKCVLADPDENLIGFAAKSFQGRSDSSYLLFSWEDGSFKEILAESLGEDDAIDQCRGIYVGNRFYLVSPDSVRAYDRTDDYRRMETLAF